MKTLYLILLFSIQHFFAFSQDKEKKIGFIDTTIITERGTIQKGLLLRGKRYGFWEENNQSGINLKKLHYFLDSNVMQVIEFEYGTLMIGEKYSCILDSNWQCKHTVGEYLGYYKNNALMQKGFFNMQGKSNGEWCIYYGNGNISQVYNLKEGIKEGKYNSYYDNKAPKAKGNYKKGKKIGVWFYYDELGVLNEEKY